MVSSGVRLLRVRGSAKHISAMVSGGVRALRACVAVAAPGAPAPWR